MRDADLKELEQRLTIPTDDGRPGLLMGWLATVYFENAWTRPVREAVADVGQQYIQQFRERLVWAQDSKTGRMYRMDKGRVPLPGNWLPDHEDGETWEFAFHGGEREGDASAFAVSALGSDDAQKGIGFLSVRLPLSWFTEHPGTLPEFLLPICKRINPISGYAGIGFLLPMTSTALQKAQPLVTPLAARFPGIEVDTPTTTSIHVGTGIKGVNWLTILSDRWVNNAGGLDYLRVRLDENTFPFYPYDGGLMIQAGAKPQIGDATRDLWPQQYVTLAKVLKKVQVKQHYRFHMGGPGPRMDGPASLAWLFRFDRK